MTTKEMRDNSQPSPECNIPWVRTFSPWESLLHKYTDLAILVNKQIPCGSNKNVTDYNKVIIIVGSRD